MWADETDMPKATSASRITLGARVSLQKGETDVRRKQENSGRLAEEFKSNPTAANYVRLRRANPQTFFASVQFAGLDAALAIEDDFSGAGVDTQLVLNALLADTSSVNRLSLQLLEMLLYRGARHGEHGGTLWKGKKSSALVDYLICIMVDAIAGHDPNTFPSDLAMLIKERLKGADADLHHKTKTEAKKSEAIWIAANMILRGEKPTLEAVAKSIRVNKTTVARYFEKEGGTAGFRRHATDLADHLRKKSYPALRITGG
jgi:hypothetical protein